MNLKNLRLYADTVRHIKPSQAFYRLRKKQLVAEASLKAFKPLQKFQLSIPVLDLDSQYAERFDIDALARDEFLIINERHRVDLGTWHTDEASHLWNFNLHYFEYCVPLAARYKQNHDYKDYLQFKRLVTSWMEACEYPNGGNGDAWHPYTISLRLVNWFICADMFQDALEGDQEFWLEMQRGAYKQYKHLLNNQEKHLLANHYLDNLKTLLICAMFFDEHDVFNSLMPDFIDQLDVQILPDGMHFERSLMYHKIMLESLLRVLRAAHCADYKLPINVEQKVRAMWDAMVSLEKGMGRTPAFNDSTDGVAKSFQSIDACCAQMVGGEVRLKTAFPDAGYYKLYDVNAALMFDAGDPTGEYESGHVHCDELSYELSVGGCPIVVNSGTYAYQSELRPYFRSTAAHNTAQFEHSEQLECWKEHRIARRGHGRIRTVSSNAIAADFTSFEGHWHHREVKLTHDTLRVRDSFPDEEDGWFYSYIHLAEGLSVLEEHDGSILFCDVNGPVARFKVDVEKSVEVKIGESAISSELGIINRSRCITLSGLTNEDISYSICFGLGNE